MGIAERKEQERQELRKRILEAAREIIEEEGLGQLSIRKIGNRIEYSPSLIYHYYRNKDEIIDSIVEDGYRRIIADVSEAAPVGVDPLEGIILGFRAYVQLVLGMPAYFKEILFAGGNIDNPRLKILKQGISERNTTFDRLRKQLEEGRERGRIVCGDPEITAQVLWCSTVGLLTRIIMEKIEEGAFRKQLVDTHLDMMKRGLENG